MDWTNEQRSAIDARNDTLLVSAAAGSGKTAVLVERIVSLIEGGMNVDEMLVVTFTRAAASEMKERIEKRLKNDPDARIRSQALLIHQAQISTLHSFCKTFLKEHFAAAGIDPMFRLGTETELAPLRRKAIEEALNEAWLSHTAETDDLFSQFEFGELEEIISDLQRFYQSLENGRDPIAKMSDNGFGAILSELKSEFSRRIIGAGSILDEMSSLLDDPNGPRRYRETYECDRDMLSSLAGIPPDEKIDFQFVRLTTKKAPEEEDPALAEAYKALRSEWKKTIQEAASLLPESIPAAEAVYDRSVKLAVTIRDIAFSADELFSEYKRQQNILDFNDLERLTALVLGNPGARAETNRKFKTVFVDEYQDISGLQESIISALHQPGINSLFMVGDVKQSIYRFRHADPGLFLRKLREYPIDPDTVERKILLNRNYRSDANLLGCINKIFRHAMRENETEIEYDDEVSLIPGDNASRGDPVEIHLLLSREDPSDGDADTGEAPKAYEREAVWIARRIRQLMNADPAEGSGKRLRYRDIVILLRNASNRAPRIAQILQDQGIPVFCDADAQFYQRSEIRDLIQLCRTICLPEDDVSFLGTLRCPCFDFSSDELALVRLSLEQGSYFHAFLKASERDDALGRKCRAVLDRLGQWRFLSRSLSLDTFLWRLLSESGLYMRSGAGPLGVERQAALRVFVSTAMGENARRPLIDFLSEIDSAVTSGDRTNARELSETDDVVRIMTLHKSKGLQFPVVFMMETARAFKFDRTALILIHKDLGMAVRITDPDDHIRLTNHAMDAIRLRLNREQRAEECRLMYVGMTRAQKKLIIVGSPKDLPALLRRSADDEWHCGKADSMLQWIVNALGREAFGSSGPYLGPRQERFMIGLEEAPELPRDGDPAAPSLPDADLSPWEDTKDEHVFAVREPQDGPTLKSSVTAILRRLRQEEDQSEAPDDKRREIPAAPAPRPYFMQLRDGMNAAERGTAMHRILGIIDLDTVRRDGVEAALEKLVGLRMLSPVEEQFLKRSTAPGTIGQFFLSPFGQRVLGAGLVRREWAFTYHIDDRLAEYIQGVIDLCFIENDEWVLCDYKTDRAEADELRDRYSDQLRLYRDALEAITDRPVKECFLYSLYLQKAIPVDPN